MNTIALFSFAGTVVLASACLMAQAPTTQKTVDYLSPAEAVPQGAAPGAKAKLLSDIEGRKTYALILKRDDEVFAALADFARQYNVTAAHFKAIGALRDVRLGWYDLSRRKYKVNPIEGQVEALSVIGDVGLADGKPAVHTHVVVGLPDGTTRGGHLLHAIASPTLEVMVTVEPATLIKKPDDYSGLTLFDPTE